MHWLGEDPRIIRRLEIGNHHRIDTKTFSQAAEEYSNNMAFFIEHAYRVLKGGGHLAILIGDGIVKGRVLKADALIERFAIQNKFSLVGKKILDLIAVSKTFIKEKDRLSKKKHYTLIFQK
jgi:SAM-dependent methyltransferase